MIKKILSILSVLSIFSISLLNAADKKIGFDTFNSQYISEKMLNQVEFRRKEFKY